MTHLYFVVRADLPEGRRAAQLVHAGMEWAARYGPWQGPVLIYGVGSRRELLRVAPAGGRTALWREPDLHNQVTAFATDQGPRRLPLLGQEV